MDSIKNVNFLSIEFMNACNNIENTSCLVFPTDNSNQPSWLRRLAGGLKYPI